MRRIAVFTDIHGNLDALKAIYSDIALEGISEIYHLGDAIAIGPEPRATLDFLLEKNIELLKGNHEIYYTDIVASDTTTVHEAELAHQKWVADELGDSYLDIIEGLDFECQLEVECVKILMCHYPYYTEEGEFKWFIGFDAIINRMKFSNSNADLYIFGHQHNGSDNVDSDGTRYINLSSAGATKENDTTYVIIEIKDGDYNVITKTISYDRLKVIEKIDKLKVPERDFIKQIFFGVE